MLQDQIELGVLLDDRNDVAADLLGVHRHLDVLVVLEAVADDRRVVVGDRQHRQQFRLRAGFQSELVGLAVLEDLFDHLALLVHLDRKHAAVVALVAVLLDRVFERAVNLAETVLQNLAEANQNRRIDAAQDELVDQLFEIDAARALSLAG